MKALAAFVLRLVAASVWRSPGEHHAPRNRYAARCAIGALHDAADVLEGNETIETDRANARMSPDEIRAWHRQIGVAS